MRVPPAAVCALFRIGESGRPPAFPRGCAAAGGAKHGHKSAGPNVKIPAHRPGRKK